MCRSKYTIGMSQLEILAEYQDCQTSKYNYRRSNSEKLRKNISKSNKKLRPNQEKGECMKKTMLFRISKVAM